MAGISLGPRQARVFDEVLDIVTADLVLVLDHFDLTEARTGLAAGGPPLPALQSQLPRADMAARLVVCRQPHLRRLLQCRWRWLRWR